MAQIIVAKYVDHMPFYRQEKNFKRLGIDLPRSTFCDWVQRVAMILLPIWESLIREVLENSFVQAEETPVKVLSKQGVKKGYLWTHGIPWREVVCDFKEGRGGIFAEEFLKACF